MQIGTWYKSLVLEGAVFVCIASPVAFLVFEGLFGGGAGGAGKMRLSFLLLFAKELCKWLELCRRREKIIILYFEP